MQHTRCRVYSFLSLLLPSLSLSPLLSSLFPSLSLFLLSPDFFHALAPGDNRPDYSSHCSLSADLVVSLVRLAGETSSIGTRFHSAKTKRAALRVLNRRWARSYGTLGSVSFFLSPFKLAPSLPFFPFKLAPSLSRSRRLFRRRLLSSSPCERETAYVARLHRAQRRFNNGHHLRSRSYDRTSLATMLDARWYDPHGTRGRTNEPTNARTHARTHARTVIFTLREDVTWPRCERQRQHHHRTLSWRPSFSGIRWRYTYANRGTRNARAYVPMKLHECAHSRALACVRGIRTSAARSIYIYIYIHAGAYRACGPLEWKCISNTNRRGNPIARDMFFTTFLLNRFLGVMFYS